jgi:predicted RNase H-related nuclease YkuK (DUF458 family)
MEKYFRTQEGELVNAVEHTLEQIDKWPNLRIYIGSDSQVYNPISRYVTAIVYRYGHRGAHYIFHVDEVPKIKDDFLRLYTEGLRTVEAAHLLTSELPVSIHALEFDYAGVKKTLSTPLVQAFKGYQNATFKGGEMISTKAADHICRHYREIMSKWPK